MVRTEDQGRRSSGHKIRAGEGQKRRSELEVFRTEDQGRRRSEVRTEDQTGGGQNRRLGQEKVRTSVAEPVHF